MQKLKRFLAGFISELPPRAIAISFVIISLFLLVFLAFRFGSAPAIELVTPSPSPSMEVEAMPTPSPTREVEVTPTSSPTPTREVEVTPSPSPTPITNRGWILFLSDREVNFWGDPTAWLINPDTGSTKKASIGLAARMGELWESYMHSPDRTHKVFVNTDGHLYIYFFQDKTSWPLYRPGSGLAYDPQWSPTGEWIVFVCTEAGWDQIQLIRPDGSERHILFDPGPGMWAKHPTFSPDGKRIVFWSNIETGRRQLFVINVDGSGLKRLASDYNDWEGVWLRE